MIKFTIYTTNGKNYGLFNSFEEAVESLKAKGWIETSVIDLPYILKNNGSVQSRAKIIPFELPRDIGLLSSIIHKDD